MGVEPEGSAFELQLGDLLSPPPTPASEDEIEATLARMREKAGEFRDVMLANLAVFDEAVEIGNRETGYLGILRDSHETYRVDHPVWFVRGETDYSERPLAGNTTAGVDRQIAIDAETGELRVAWRIPDRGVYRTPSQRHADDRFGRHAYRVGPDDHVDAEALFDTQHVMPAELSEIETEWAADLCRSAVRYRRTEPIRPEDYEPLAVETTIRYHSNPGPH